MSRVLIQFIHYFFSFYPGTTKMSTYLKVYKMGDIVDIKVSSVELMPLF